MLKTSKKKVDTKKNEPKSDARSKRKITLEELKENMLQDVTGGTCDGNGPPRMAF